MHTQYTVLHMYLQKGSVVMGFYNLGQILPILARTYVQLPLRQWGAGNVYLLVLFSWKVNIAENPIAVMGL